MYRRSNGFSSTHSDQPLCCCRVHLCLFLSTYCYSEKRTTPLTYLHCFPDTVVEDGVAAVAEGRGLEHLIKEFGETLLHGGSLDRLFYLSQQRAASIFSFSVRDFLKFRFVRHFLCIARRVANHNRSEGRSRPAGNESGRVFTYSGSRVALFFADSVGFGVRTSVAWVSSGNARTVF